MFEDKKTKCQIYDTFQHSYEEKMDIIKEAVNKNEKIVFVTMGDPFIYGAIGGIIDRLEKANISFEIVPGVSAVNASSAILKRGMTGLGTSNTAICTSYKDVSNPIEYLEKIASLKASVALFMSVNKIEEICDVFMKHYSEDTAVVVISKATWVEEKIVRGSLKTIADDVQSNGVEEGLILIGDFIDREYDYILEKEFMERKKKESLRQ